MNMSNIEPHGTYSIIDIYIYICFCGKYFWEYHFLEPYSYLQHPIATNVLQLIRSEPSIFLDQQSHVVCRGGLPVRKMCVNSSILSGFSLAHWFIMINHHFSGNHHFQPFFLVFHGFFIDPSFFMSEKSSKERSGGPSSQAFSHHPSYWSSWRSRDEKKMWLTTTQRPSGPIGT